MEEIYERYVPPPKVSSPVDGRKSPLRSSKSPRRSRSVTSYLTQLTTKRVWHSYMEVSAEELDQFKTGSHHCYGDTFVDTNELLLAKNKYWLRYRVVEVDGKRQESWTLKRCAMLQGYVTYTKFTGDHDAMLGHLKKLDQVSDYCKVAKSLHEVFNVVVTAYAAVRYYHPTPPIGCRLWVDVVDLGIDDFYTVGAVDFVLPDGVIPLDADNGVRLPSKFYEALRTKNPARLAEFEALFPEFATYVDASFCHAPCPPSFMVYDFATLVESDVEDETSL